MNNFTLAQKQALEALVEAGTQVSTLSYDPTTNDGASLEANALADGWTEYYREDAATLVEVIYTK